MRCPSLNQLPSSPNGKTGWPWTEESQKLQDAAADGLPWPKISIITPSYNQGDYIEETIRSVLLQGYPDLEYIIIDGGSSDGSVEIIKKYERWIDFWISEKDRGQSNALNKGFSLATGNIVSWLNSDDVYIHDSLSIVSAYFMRHDGLDIVYGDGELIDENSSYIEYRKSRAITRTRGINSFIPNPIFQPSVFFTRAMFSRTGFLDEDLNYVMDLDFWIRGFPSAKVRYINTPLSRFRLYGKGKTSSGSLKFLSEELALINRYNGSSELFNRRLSFLTYQKSILEDISCERALNEILNELQGAGMDSKYTECANRNKTDLLADAYLWQSDYFYNTYEFKKSRDNLRHAVSISVHTLRRFKFWRLLLSVLLPPNIVKHLRKFTRRSQSNFQGWDWVKGK